MLKRYYVLGKLFRDNTLYVFIGCWRHTERQLNFVLDSSGDPDQIAEETTQMVTGVFADATLHTI